MIKPLAALALLLSLAGPLPAQHPTPPVNGVYVPPTRNSPGLALGQTALTPIQTELVGPLDISRLKVGSPVLAKLAVPWSGAGCQLRVGSILGGHVAEIEPRTKQNRVSRLTVLFDSADCGGTPSTPFPTTLVALLAGTLGGDTSLTEGQPLADAVGLAVAGGIRSADAASAITDYSPLPTRKLPSQVLPGQVVGLSRIQLSVGSGVKGGSVLSSPNHDLRLEAATHLILMPRPAETAAATVPPPNVPRTSPPPAAPTPDPVDETDLCLSDCSSVPSTGLASLPSAPALTLAIKPLGYSPKENREVTSFGYDASITYLDAHDLLFTFDPHKLRERGGGFRHEGFRTVRAVIVDPSTQTVKRVLDWRVQGEGRYIWRVGDDRLLVHVGRQLRLFGPDLSPIRAVSLPGSLAWLSAAPSGNHFAVGIYDERHSPEVHQHLLDVTGEDPEEDIDVQLYDGELNLLLSSPRSSSSHAPVLSDLGEIRTRLISHTQWQISEYRWDRTDHKIARTTSSCRPRITTLPSGYLFVIGCDSTPGILWYRMLRPDGHPVLKGHSPSAEIEQASTSVSPDEFALRIVKALRPMSPGQPFRRTDIESQVISVYRTSDGHRLFSTSAAEVPMAEQSFALSPEGNQVALIGDSAIRFYAVSPHTAP